MSKLNCRNSKLYWWKWYINGLFEDVIWIVIDEDIFVKLTFAENELTRINPSEKLNELYYSSIIINYICR